MSTTAFIVQPMRPICKTCPWTPNLMRVPSTRHGAQTSNRRRDCTGEDSTTIAIGTTTCGWRTASVRVAGTTALPACAKEMDSPSAKAALGRLEPVPKVDVAAQTFTGGQVSFEVVVTVGFSAAPVTAQAEKD